MIQACTPAARYRSGSGICSTNGVSASVETAEALNTAGRLLLTSEWIPPLRTTNGEASSRFCFAALFAIRQDTIRFNLHEPFRLDETADFEKCARRPYVGEELAVRARRIPPSGNVGEE